MTESQPARRPSNPTISSAYLLKPDGCWSEYDLRDYIVTQISLRHPDLLAQRRPVIETSICKGFIKRHGAERAAAIARFAFERMEGVITGRKVDFGRFTQAADPYFAAQIIKMLPADAATPQDAA